MKLPHDAPARTLPQLVRWIGAGGDRPIITATSASGHELTLDAGDLPDLVGRAGAFLQSEGIERSDRVALHLDNSSAIEALILHLAITWIGAVAVPIGTRLSKIEVHRQLEHCRAAAVIVRSAHVENVVGLPGTRLINCESGLLALVQGQGCIPDVGVTESDLADILYTSGTTGAPKGAEFTHGNCVSCGCELQEAMGISENDVLHTAVPWYTSTGAHTNPFTAYVARAHYVVDRQFDQRLTVERMNRWRTTTYFGVPSMLRLLLRDVPLGSDTPPTLRRVVFGGSVTTREDLDGLLRALPGRDLINLFGQTEAGPGGLVIGPDDIVDKPGSIGRRGNGSNTKFAVLRQDGSPASVGEVGEIVLRSPAVMRGYHRNPEATRLVLRGGWLHTTDLGTMDEDGFLWFVDRRADLVIRGGFNISTVEVEAVLEQHPAIAEAAVIGVPHDILGQDLQAFVVLRSPVDDADLAHFASGQLADYKVPRRYEVLDTLPRNAMGKLVKRELRLVRNSEIGSS